MNRNREWFPLLSKKQSASPMMIARPFWFNTTILVAALLPALLVALAQQDCPAGSSQSPLSGSAVPKTSDQSAAAADNGAITLEWLASQLAASKFRNIIVLNGAGVSVNAGIPDFRTPGTGLYSQLAQYNLPYPEAMFELDYFRQNPQPFVQVAQAIWPGQENGPKPTLAHAFVALLEQKSLLRRVYTQNIDGLERLAGVSDEKLIECHGNFRSCSCVECKKVKINAKECRDFYVNKKEAYQCPECGGLVKPDIVFFGETMPQTFMEYIDDDTDACDLLIVMGTSLLVNPVALIPKFVGPHVPRLLINKDLVGDFQGIAGRRKKNDVFVAGDCDEGVRRLCELAGRDWLTRIDALHKTSSNE